MFFSSEVVVSVEVEDANDNSPVFINEPYEAVITEVYHFENSFRHP